MAKNNLARDPAVRRFLKVSERSRTVHHDRMRSMIISCCVRIRTCRYVQRITEPRMYKVIRKDHSEVRGKWRILYSFQVYFQISPPFAKMIFKLLEKFTISITFSTSTSQCSFSEQKIDHIKYKNLPTTKKWVKIESYIISWKNFQKNRQKYLKFWLNIVKTALKNCENCWIRMIFQKILRLFTVIFNIITPNCSANHRGNQKSIQGRFFGEGEVQRSSR